LFEEKSTFLGIGHEDECRPASDGVRGLFAAEGFSLVKVVEGGADHPPFMAGYTGELGSVDDEAGDFLASAGASDSSFFRVEDKALIGDDFAGCAQEVADARVSLMIGGETESQVVCVP
jgi:hypothetical protein